MGSGKKVCLLFYSSVCTVVTSNRIWFDNLTDAEGVKPWGVISGFIMKVFFSCAANEGCNDYHPMFFTHDRAWEEFFCVCIQLLNKTWKEMRATAEDFNKVLNNML